MQHLIRLSNSEIIVSQSAEKQLSAWIEANQYSKVFLLVDTNTHEYCLTNFLKNFATYLPIEVIEIPAGEEGKNIETCSQVWQAMSELKADRNSLLINLGGGVVTDLGGFVACTYRRGIDFVHFPTSLLAMVDASIGGKNGVDLGNLKNQVGVIQQPPKVFINPAYLNTLPTQQMKSGLAEMLKHGLIYNPTYWSKFEQMHQMDASVLEDLILESIEIKVSVVEADPTEKGIRKTLNFGHTLGHAIESYFLGDSKKQLLHGEAVAVGMILAAFLSVELVSMPISQLNRIVEVITRYFSKVSFTSEDIAKIIQLTKFDKKNRGDQVNFVLLEEIGKSKIDCVVPENAIQDAFQFYQDIEF